jgi:hypothetical protein
VLVSVSRLCFILYATIFFFLVSLGVDTIYDILFIFSSAVNIDVHSFYLILNSSHENEMVERLAIILTRQILIYAYVKHFEQY